MAKPPVETKQFTNYQIVSSLFPNTPASWDSRINLSSQQYWNNAQLLIASDGFEAVRNEIFQNLINRIAIVVIRNRNFYNPLEMFKNGLMPYGDTIQEIASDVIEAEEFQTGKTDQFEYSENDVKAVYHRINRQQFYKRTIDDSVVQRAFTNEYGLQSLTNQLVKSLTDSNVIDEFLYTKRAIAGFKDQTAYPILPTQLLEVPSVSSEKRTHHDINVFLERVKTLLRMIQFPNRKYNASRQMNQVAPDDVVLVLNANVISINEVHNLAQAFRPEFLDLNIPIIAVDQLSESDPSIIGAIISKKALDIRTTKETMRLADNARSLYTNMYFHIHQIYAVSPFETIIYIKETK